jgi:hypothetical protein
MPELLDLSTKHCRVERDGHVVILTMDRPEARNALSPDMLVGLADGFDYVAGFKRCCGTRRSRKALGGPPVESKRPRWESHRHFRGRCVARGEHGRSSV